jgi:ribosomal protein S18 acetylase RimI-like enzyme
MWPTFVSAVAGSWVCVEDDVAAFDSGTDIARFNAVAAPVAAAPGTVGRLVEALAARTDWFSLHTPVPCSRALQELAHDLHLIEEQEPLMLLEDRRHLVPAANRSSAEIRRLRPDEMERHVDVWARGFGVPPGALDPWLRSDLLIRPNVIAYQASVDGADVATALGIVADGFVGVFNVACVESHRRRGYGAALTARVVLDGLSSGAGRAVLTSSPSGEGVYRALGFREVARWAQWLPEDIEPD